MSSICTIAAYSDLSQKERYFYVTVERVRISSQELDRNYIIQQILLTQIKAFFIVVSYSAQSETLEILFSTNRKVI